MPFGLSNVLVRFEGHINRIVDENLDIFVMVYWDDIVIYTKKLNQLQVDIIQ